MSSPKKEWRVVAHETLVHTWTVEAETEDEALDIAHEGCPLPDGECSSQQFDIISVQEEEPAPGKWIEPRFRLDVFLDKWTTVSRGLTQEKALEESKQFTRFKIIPEREGAS